MPVFIRLLATKPEKKVIFISESIEIDSETVDFHQWHENDVETIPACLLF